VEFARTRADETGRALPRGETFTLEADMVLKAVGQVFVADPLRQDGALALATEDGRIAVDADRRTSLPRVYAGGDCVAGLDLTVSAVQDGKIAAEAIHRQLIG
jgi:glutamate synthase (NADPH/NADH) small chain